MSDQQRQFHIGAQNDALYIISGRAPALNNDYPVHDADRTCVAKIYDEAEAKRLVGLQAECVRLSYDNQQMERGKAELQAECERLKRDLAHQTDMANQADVACMRVAAERDALKSRQARVLAEVPSTEPMKYEAWLHAPKEQDRSFNDYLREFHKHSALHLAAKLIEAQSCTESMREALGSLLPGLVLDLRYAEVDDDREAMQSRIDTVIEALTIAQCSPQPNHGESIRE